MEVDPNILAELYAELKEAENNLEGPGLVNKKKLNSYMVLSAHRRETAGQKNNDSEYDTMNLSNLDSDINSVLKTGKEKIRFKLFNREITTTGDEGGGITVNDNSETDPELDLRGILSCISPKNVSNQLKKVAQNQIFRK